MQTLSFLLSCLIAVSCFNCSNGTSATYSGTETEELCPYDFTESLKFWTTDTIVKLNPRLVHLMDTLYQYIRQEHALNDLNSNIKWMSNYRDKLCNYYRETRQTDSISDCVMADSIIEEANILWNLPKDDSTMGMIVNNDIERTRLIFQHYNEFEKLNRLSETEQQRAMLRTEFAEWMKLENLFYKIFSNCVSLKYWGGSISGPIKTAGTLEILQAHINLYKKEYLILTGALDSWKDDGTFLNPAKNLLIECCEQAYIEYVYHNDTCMNQDDFKRLRKKTKSLIKKLPKQIEEWCKARQPWEEEMCTDWLRPEYPRHTSEVLMKLAHIISSIQ